MIEGFTLYNGDSLCRIFGFTAKCEKCGSKQVTIKYELKFCGVDGYDIDLDIGCRSCGFGCVLLSVNRG